MTSLVELGRAYKELPRKYLAGNLVTTSIPDRSITPNQLRTLLTNEGLDPTVVPQKRDEILDYRNACRSVETRRGVREGQRQIVTVGEVDTNATESVYQITAEVRDKANRVIEHQKGMRVVYDKQRAGDPVVGGDPIRFEPIDSDALYQSLHTLADDINGHFLAHRGSLPGPKVREILRAAFANMHGTRWSRTSSLWFIAPEHEPTLEKWGRVIDALYGNDAVFELWPLPNTGATRQKLERKVGEHIKDDTTKLIADAAKLLAGGAKIKPKQYQRMLESTLEIKTHAQKMQALYGEEIGAVTDALKLVDIQMREMWERTT